MWVFADFGLLMPASVPSLDDAKLTKRERENLAKFTENGKFDLQVRGRVREHLQYFMDVYMEPGSFYPEIHETPEMDYNVRFYTTRQALAEAMTFLIGDIDYEKFKPTAERFEWGKIYHTVLNSIWSSVTRLGSPGGSWGPKSKSNPRGYSSAKEYEDLYGKGSYSSSKWVGSSFYDDYDAIDFGDGYSTHFDDWVPERQEEIELILGSLEGIPVEQWEECCSQREWDLIQPIWQDEMEAQAEREREEARRERRARRKHKRRQKNQGRRYVTRK